jgi:hypothetical protein
MRPRRDVRALCSMLACALLGCTHDFSGFHFLEKPPVVDKTPAAPGDAGSNAQPSDAAVRVFDAATGPGTPADAAKPSATPDAGNNPKPLDDSGMLTAPRDAGAIHMDADAGDDRDAHVPTDAEQCRSTWADKRLSDLACTQCACDQCTSPSLDCLSRGTTENRTLCTNLVACALAHGCHDWDCYCSTNGCRMGMGAPDGPCVGAMNAAAGGERDRVLAVHQQNDPNQPLVRAVRAIGCTTGQSRSAVGGMMTGKCSACARQPN